MIGLFAGLGAASASAQTLNATFTSATTVPVVAPSYTATGTTVNLALAYAPATGTSLTVVQNTGLDFISGTFANLAQGQAVQLTYGGVTYGFVANYFGGTGNDLVLQWAGAVPAAWGQNDSGQLGDGSITPRPTPAAVTNTGVLAGKTVISLAAGSAHNLALCSDGTLAAWGNNQFGQLGDNSTTQRSTPVGISGGALAGKTVVAVAAGENHSLALCADGTVAAWGSGQLGQLGNGLPFDSSTPVAVSVSGALAGKTVVAIAAGRYHSLALCSDGTVAAWGANGSGQLGDNSRINRLSPVAVDTNLVLAGRTVVAIAAGERHSLALCSDGTLAAWGENNLGQLGDGSGSDSTTPVAVDTSGILAGRTVIAIAAGTFHSLALCSDSTVAAWGFNDFGQLGASTNSVIQNFPIGVTNSGALAGKTVASLAAGNAHSLALCSDGTLVGWGRNTFGQLGDTPLAGGNLPVVVPPNGFLAGRTVVSVTAGFGHSLALVASPPPPILTLSPATGLTSTGVTLNGTTNPSGLDATVSFEYGLTASYGSTVAATPSSVSGTAPVAVSATLSGLTPATTYYYRLIVVTSYGTFTSAGQTFATPLPPLDATFTSAATVPATAVSYNATGRILNLSLNFAPVTGTSLTVVRNTGLGLFSTRFANLAQGQVVELTFGGVTYTFVANYYGGSGNDLVLQWAGSLPVAWGYGFDGQIGDGVSLVARLPVAVVSNGALAGKTVVSVAAGQSHSLALCSDGTLVAWGRNDVGQLGDGTTSRRTTPVAITGSGALAGRTVIAISADGDHNLALCSDGTVAAWGVNSFGQIGDGTTSTRTTPVAVSANGALVGKSVVAIATGSVHSLALCSDGTLVAWGQNYYGQMGDNTTTDRLTPVAISGNGALAGKSVVALAVGADHNLALCSDGALIAWGYNGYGQLGNNSTTPPNTPRASTPVAITGSGALAGKSVTAVAAGEDFSFALCSDGTLASWGLNNYGQLGDASTTNRLTPVAITGNGALAGKTLASLVAGRYHSIALCTDGTIATWGQNISGELGDGTSFNRSTPGAITGNGALAGKTVVSVAAGSSHNIALVATPPSPAFSVSPVTALTSTGATLNGTVNPSGASASVSFAYGLTPSYGSTITATPSSVSGTSPTAVSATLSGLTPGTTYHYRVTAVTANGTFTSADQTFTTLASQTITFTNPGTRTFGDDPFVLSATASSNLPVSFSVVSGPATLSGNTLTLTGTGTVVVRASQAGNATYAAAPDVDQAFTVLSPGALDATFTSAATVPATAASYNATGRALNLSLQFAPATGSSLTVVNNTGLGFISGRFTNLAQGQTVALSYGGVTYSYVANYYGGTGNDLVLQWAGTVATGWGWNGFSQLGDGTTTDRLTPVAVSADGVLAGKTVVALAAGNLHSLALCSDGTLASWGRNNYGQLGDNSNTSRLAPVAVSTSGVLAGKTVIAIANGDSHSIALCSDGTLVGWGRNDAGQLGDNSSTHRSTPVGVANTGALAGKTVVAIAAGYDHTLALCSDGTLVAWGFNGNGQLGDGTVVSKTAPVAVIASGALLGKNVVSIAASAGHSFALCSDGTLVAWGENNYGQLGDNSTIDRLAPVTVPLNGALAGKTIAAIAAGAFHTLARCTDGTLAAWGWNALGQLGDNTTTDRLIPVAVTTSGVLSGKTVVSIKAGYAFNLALCSDGTLASWGDNGSGQLGDTTTTNRLTPVAVSTNGARSGKTVVAAAPGTYYSLALAAAPPTPALTVAASSALTSTGVTLSGSVNPFGTSATVSFAYGLTPSYGSTVSATPSQVSGSTPTAVSATLAGLNPGTTYHYQLVVVTGNGTFTSANQSFTTQSSQTITFANPGTRIYGDAPFDLSATASSGLPVSFSVVSGPASLNGSTLTLTGPGAVVVRASQAGNATYAAAPAVDQSFIVLTPFDGWRAAWFSPEELAQPAVSGPAADPDGDGIPNLLEYALGTPPRVAGVTGLPTSSISASRLQLTFTPLRSDVTYLVEASSDLASWSNIAVNPGIIGSPVTVTDSVIITPSNPRRFLRLRVTSP
ncbi:MAG: hypothetical protein JSR82_16145 [Verrucomicrobia bacterium]|nr:hypothetical protein [Verrucomicrobiota bacterium]